MIYCDLRCSLALVLGQGLYLEAFSTKAPPVLTGIPVYQMYYQSHGYKYLYLIQRPQV